MHSYLGLGLIFLLQLCSNHANNSLNTPTDNTPNTAHRLRSSDLYTQRPSVCTPRLDLEPHVIPLLPGFRVSEVEEQILQGCKPACKNGGICRESGVKDGSKQCLCPQNFTGPTCEQDNIPRLVACDEATCQNGGFCLGTDTQPVCSCPENIRGSLCERRARSYDVVFSIIGHQSEPHSLANLTELASAALNMLQLSAKLGDDLTLASAYLESELEPITNDTGGILSARVLFDFNDSLAVQYTNQCVLGHVITGMDALSKMLNNEDDSKLGSVKMSELDVQVENLCSTGNHDCSRHAVCVPTNLGTYTCQCNTFTIDVSMDDRFPGRRCVYDGLIILTFVLVGFVLSTLIILFCGCRRTIWYRCCGKNSGEHMTLVNVAQNYDI